jgi:hypothetical protein
VHVTAAASQPASTRGAAASALLLLLLVVVVLLGSEVPVPAAVVLQQLKRRHHFCCCCYQWQSLRMRQIKRNKEDANTVTCHHVIYGAKIQFHLTTERILQAGAGIHPVGMSYAVCYIPLLLLIRVSQQCSVQ